MVMGIQKIATVAQSITKLGANTIENNNSFKSIMAKKRAVVEKIDQVANMKPPQNISIHSLTQEVVHNHQKAMQTIKTFMTRTDYTPDRIIAIQYQSGILFLREQMYSKAAEQSANTFKNFSQMQVG